MKNSPLSTSFRSATQATDSTRNGWMANTAATKALGQRSPVIRRRTRKRRIARGGVQQDIGQVVSAGVIQSVELAIQHVGEPSQRVPVAGMSSA